jgi:hypothetical protein
MAASGGRGGDALAVAVAHALSQAVGGGRAVARGLDHGGEREFGRREQFHLAAAVVDQLAGIVGEADEARLRKHRRRSVAELIIEPAPDEQHDVGLAHGGAAHRGSDRGMIGGHQAAAFLRVEVEGAGGVEQAQQRRSGAARPAPGDDERALRRPEHIDRRGDRRRLGQQPARRLGLHPFVEHELRRHAATQHVDRDFGVDRAGLAGIAARRRLSSSRTTCSATLSVRAVRVTGRRMSTCGMPCSGPMFACGRGGQPPISRTGARARKALATAVTVLVTPGPAVTRATPNPPASSACACAMCTAAPSSRTSMMRMPCWATWSQSGWICPPCRPKTRSMPRVLRKRATHAAQVCGSAFKSCVAVTASFMARL